MPDKEQIQESQYHFPYHYLTYSENGKFTLSQFLQWGLVHASYTEWLTKKIIDMKPGSVMDAGCGDGRTLFELENAGFEGKKMLGIDFSERAIHFAKGFTKTSRFTTHDISESPTDEKFELCVSFEVIEHIPPEKIDSYVKNISLSLEQGGKLLISTPTTNIPTNKKHYQHFTAEILETYLKDYFEIEEIEYLNHENYWSNILSRILANKFFIINSQAVKDFFFSRYKKKYLHATKETGSRIVVLAKKKFTSS